MRDRFRPAIRAAAVALTHGWDPIVYMHLPALEARVAEEVLRTAEDIEQERRKAMIKATQVAVQNGVAKAFGG